MMLSPIQIQMPPPPKLGVLPQRSTPLSILDQTTSSGTAFTGPTATKPLTVPPIATPVPTVWQQKPELALSSMAPASLAATSLIHSFSPEKLTTFFDNFDPTRIGAESAPILSYTNFFGYDLTKIDNFDKIQLVLEVAGKVAEFAVLGAVAWFASGFLEKKTQTLIQNLSISESNKTILSNIAKGARITSLIMGALMTFAWMGGDFKVLFGGSAVAGAAIGGAILLGSKDFFIDIGKTIIQKIQNDYELGDHIEVPIGLDEAKGIIVEQGFFRTVIIEEVENEDKTIIHRIPNSALYGLVREIPEKMASPEKLEELLKALKAHDAENGVSTTDNEANPPNSKTEINI